MNSWLERHYNRPIACKLFLLLSSIWKLVCLKVFYTFPYVFLTSKGNWLWSHITQTHSCGIFWVEALYVCKFDVPEFFSFGDFYIHNIDTYTLFSPLVFVPKTLDADASSPCVWSYGIYDWKSFHRIYTETPLLDCETLCEASILLQFWKFFCSSPQYICICTHKERALIHEFFYEHWNTFHRLL